MEENVAARDVLTGTPLGIVEPELVRRSAVPTGQASHETFLAPTIKSAGCERENVRDTIVQTLDCVSD